MDGGAPDPHSDTAPGDSDVAVDRLDAWRRAGEPVAVLDVREPWETAICALPGSLLVPMGRVPAHLEALPRDRPLVVLCHHGIRSAHVAAWLRAHGLTNAVNLAGGIDAWARRIEPEMRRY
jgi:rhodanese-related sulfurtransferase